MSAKDFRRVRMTLVQLLHRLRYTLPCPIAAMDLYWMAFPDPHLARLVGKELLSELTARNIQEAMRENNELTLRFDDSDFSLLLRMDETVIVPAGDNGFTLPSLASLPQLADWCPKAQQLEGQINEFVQKIYAITGHTEKIAELAIAWPEAVKLVPELEYSKATQRIAAKSEHSKKLRGLVLQHFPPEDMEVFTSMLATATLMPANPHDHPTVWVP